MGAEAGVKQVAVSCRNSKRSAGEEAARVLSRVLMGVWRQLKAVRRAGGGPFQSDERLEPVHQLRVLARRATEAVKLFRELPPRLGAEQMRAVLRQIRKAADEARDLDVTIASLNQGVTLLGGPSDTGSTQGLVQRLAKSRQQAQEPLDGLLDKLERADFKARIERYAAAVANTKRTRKKDCEDLKRLARKGVKRAAKQFFEAGTADLAQDSKLHEFRIRAKKLRYAMELTAPCFDAKIKARIEQVKILQEVSGDIHDHVVAIDVFTGFREEAAYAHERAFFEGLLQGEMRARAELWLVFQMIWSEEIAGELKEGIEAAI